MKFLRSEVATINGKQFSVFELYLPTLRGKNRSIRATTSVGGQQTIFEFLVPQEAEAAWIPLFNKSLE